MERRLAAQARAWLSLGSMAVALLSGGAGCEPISGPNDPKITPKEEKKLRERAYTPEQAQERANRPR